MKKQRTHEPFLNNLKTPRKGKTMPLTEPDFTRSRLRVCTCVCVCARVHCLFSNNPIDVNDTIIETVNHLLQHLKERGCADSVEIGIGVQDIDLQR